MVNSGGRVGWGAQSEEELSEREKGMIDVGAEAPPYSSTPN